MGEKIQKSMSAQVCVGIHAENSGIALKLSESE